MQRKKSKNLTKRKRQLMNREKICTFAVGKFLVIYLLFYSFWWLRYAELCYDIPRNGLKAKKIEAV